MSLFAALVALSSPDLSPKERNHRVKSLDKLLRARFERSLAQLCGDCFHDAVNELLEKAALGSERFAGSSEGEAYNYCRAALRNHCLQVLRKEKRIERGGADFEEEAARSPVGLVDPAEITERQAAAIYQGFLRKLGDKVSALAAAHEAAAGRQVECFVDWQIRGDQDGQLERWGYAPPYQDEPRDGNSLRRAWNRVYTARTRGRNRLIEAARALRAQGDLDDTEERFVRALLGGLELTDEGGGLPGGEHKGGAEN